MLNEKMFRAIYDDFLASGLTTRDYCANQQMNEAKFYYWQNKLKGHLPPKRGFVPLVFNPQRPTSAPAVFGDQQQQHPGSRDGLCCEISYPNGISVKLSGMADAGILCPLLQLTGQ
ncbi:MAG: IS66 family insertion sequence element accessory protein TnpA [Draconibacterium sp.]